MKKQATNLLKLAVIAGFMTGAAAQADDHAKGHDAAAKPSAESHNAAEKADTKGDAKKKKMAEMKAKGEDNHSAHAEEPAAATKKK
jgi:hypothetical protein